MEIDFASVLGTHETISELRFKFDDFAMQNDGMMFHFFPVMILRVSWIHFSSAVKVAFTAQTISSAAWLCRTVRAASRSGPGN